MKPSLFEYPEGFHEKRKLVVKARNMLRAQNKPDDDEAVCNFLKKEGYEISLEDVEDATNLYVREIRGNSVHHVNEDGDPITWQEYQEAQNNPTPKERRDEINRKEHQNRMRREVYNIMEPSKEKEFIKTILWEELGYKQPAYLKGEMTNEKQNQISALFNLSREEAIKILRDFQQDTDHLDEQLLKKLLERSFPD